MLIEPSRTPYDLQFTLLGVPVRVHPFFWLTAVILGAGGLQGSPQPMLELLLWVGVVFVSILVHEFGHATAIRAYGWRPWITLYAFGGLASYEPGYSPAYSSHRKKGNTTWGQIIISLAGPAAGFLLAGLAIVALYAAGRYLVFPLLAWNVTLGWGAPLFDDGYWVTVLVWQLLWVNIYWGLINLLPVFPLDGGKVSRELFLAYSPRDGYRQSLWVSVFTGVGLAVYGLSRQEVWMGILFGLLAFQSYQLLQQHRGGW